MRIWVGGGVEKGKTQAEDESWCTETPIKNDSRWKTRQHTEKQEILGWKMGKGERIARISMCRGKYLE